MSPVGYYLDKPQSEIGYVVTPIGDEEATDELIESHRPNAIEGAARQGGVLTARPPRVTHLTYTVGGESTPVRCLQWEMTR